MNSLLSTALAMGVLGGVHCVGMCGGIAGALAMRAQGNSFLIQSFHNLGRIASYGIGGLVVGSIGQASFLYSGLLPVQTVLLTVANILLIFVGAYLAGWSRAILILEKAGRHLWNSLRFGVRTKVPADSPAGAFLLGLAWGTLPCGLVYSAYAIALVAGDSLRGGEIMIAFGLGTLPNLLVAGMAAQKVRDFAKRSSLRTIAGITIIAFGIIGLLRVPDLGEIIRAGVMCFT